MQTETRDVALTIPANAGYLVLARLALGAVCRLTQLEPEEVAYLKLAVTESSHDFIDGKSEHELGYVLHLSSDRLVIEVTGTPAAGQSPDRELGRAIIDATVDESEFTQGHTVLTKHLAAGAG